MSKYQDSHEVKIEAGQILHPGHFPPPNELVCIQVPKIFDQVAIRDCKALVNFPLSEAKTASANATFLRAFDFDIKDIAILSQSDSMTRPGFKKLVLRVTVCFKVEYSYFDGCTIESAVIPSACQPVPPCVTFDVTINEIYCPSCTTQIGVVRYPSEKWDKLADKDGTHIKAEAILEAFNPMVRQANSQPNTPTATLTIDIGAFFVIKCECDVQLLMPAYGYCPVPPEQQNPAEQTCKTFNNRLLTPFPNQFFPNQKVNPLDISKKDDWDD